MNAENTEALSPELQRALEPLLSAIEERRNAEYNDRIEALGQESHPVVEPMKQIKGTPCHGRRFHKLARFIRPFECR